MTKSVYALAAAVLVAGFSGCTLTGDASSKAGDSASGTGPVEREIVIPVEAQPPTRGSISAYFETTSRIVAENRVEVTTKSSGTCVELLAEEGETVQEGHVLAVLQQPEAKQALSAAEIQVPHRKVEFERAQKGFSLGLNSQSELDAARSTYEQAKSSVEQQRVLVDNLTIRAPINGVITARNVQQGQLVPAGQSVFTMVDPESYILRISAPEQELPRLHPGQVALVNIDALGGKQCEARVRRINPAVDRATLMFDVVLDFDPEIRAQLMDAAFARARLIMETHDNALLVPKDVIVEENARKYLFLVRPPKDAGAQTAQQPETPASTDPAATPQDGTVATAQNDAAAAAIAERVEVQVGLEDKDHVEILSGLRDDDLVVTVGQHNLKTGTKIDVLNTADAIVAKIDVDADEALQDARAKRESEEQQGPTEQRRRRGRRMH